MSFLATPLKEVYRIWRGGKIVAHKQLPPGRYTVKCIKVQADWKGRLQHHWELVE